MGCTLQPLDCGRHRLQYGLVFSIESAGLDVLQYITNYATKDENSTYQMVTAAAVSKDSQERAKAATEANDEERNASEIAMRNFALRIFNCMSLHREVSGVQVASSLLRLPTYYAPHSELRHIIFDAGLKLLFADPIW